jgi:hypothetical protein
MAQLDQLVVQDRREHPEAQQAHVEQQVTLVVQDQRGQLVLLVHLVPQETLVPLGLMATLAILVVKVSAAHRVQLEIPVPLAQLDLLDPLVLLVM